MYSIQMITVNSKSHIAKNRERGDDQGVAGLYKNPQIPSLPPKSQVRDVTFHLIFQMFLNFLKFFFQITLALCLTLAFWTDPGKTYFTLKLKKNTL